jgi:PAS domain S-box-containing protein
MHGVKIKDLPKKFTLRKELQSSDVFYKHVVELTPEAVVIHCEGTIIYANPAALKLIGAKKASELIGKPVMKFIHPDSIPLIKSRITKMLNKQIIAPFVDEKFISITGKTVYVETKAVPFMFQGKRAILAILRDNSERKKTEEKQKFLFEVSTILAKSVEYKTTLNNICKLLVPYLADYIRIALLDDSNQIREVAAYHKDQKKKVLVEKLYDSYRNRENLTHGVSKILQSGRPEVIENVSSQYTSNLKSNSKLKKIVKELGLISYMGIPLKINKKIVGVITFSSTKKEKKYTKEEVQFAEEIALQIAYAVENALLFNSVQKELNEKIKAKEAEERMASYLDQTFDAILLWEYTGKIVYWNKGAEEMYGFTKEQAIGQKTHQLLKTVHPIPYSQIQSILNKNGRWEGELTHTTKENKPVTVSCKKILISEKNGQKYILETNRDITERIYFQKNLEYFSEASKILSSSLDYKITLGNIAMLAVPHMADWCSIEIKTDKGIEQLAVAHVDPKKVAWAKNLNKKNPPDPNAKDGVPNVIRTGKSEYYSHIPDEMLVAAAKDEEQLKLLRDLKFSSIIIAPIRTNNETIGAITFVSAESKRHYTKSDLVIAEELSARAGLAIENARLYREAQVAISVRDEFISLASHELKTPITSLKMFTQSLGSYFEKRNDTFLQKYFKKIDQQTDRLALIVNDLLNVSKIQHGKLDYDLKKVDLNSVVKDTVEMLQSTSMNHKISIRGSLQKNVYADPDRIYQVLTNLLTNAIKYSPLADKVIVQMKSTKDFAVVDVQDFGIGIKPAEQKKIFQQFYRVNDPDDKKFPGLGMGLFISHEIIMRHGGNMVVKSIKGKGSQFSFTLPYNKVVT